MTDKPRDLTAAFDMECEVAGLQVSDDERDLIFDLWKENLPRRTALREVSFGYDDAAFANPNRPEEFAKGTFTPTEPTDDPLHWKTASELAGLLSRREVSSREVVQACLDRIDACDPVLRAFEVVIPDAALEAADAADSAYARGETVSPLQGVPVAFKCFAAITGLPHTVGAESREHVIAKASSEVVRRMDQSGAIKLGLTRTHQWGAGMATKEGKWATGRNPWNIDRIPGGSSSGTAVAVSSGMLPGAMGNDAAGSIRMPAVNCNLVGLKTTIGLVSNRGIPPYCWSLDVCGPLTRSVTDAALYLEGMIGPHAFGRYSADLDRPLAGRVIGVPRTYFWNRDDIREDVRQRCEDALQVLEQAGAVLKTVEIANAHWNDAIYTTLIAEAHQVHGEGMKNDRNYAGAWFRGHILTAALFTAEDLVRAHRIRARLARELEEVFKEVEALVVPGQAVPATPFSSSFIRALTQPRSQFMRPFNVTGLPAVAVPCGFSDDGMPVGINLAGPAFGERELLSIARGYERETGFGRRRPDETRWVA